MAAAILQDLAHVEVAVRNAYNAALAAYQPGPVHWTDDVMRYFPVVWRTAKDGRRYDENEAPRDQLTYARKAVGLRDMRDVRVIESRWVVGFRVVLDAYRAVVMAAMVSVSLVGCRRAMEVSER
jgi:hypothetical protein